VKDGEIGSHRGGTLDDRCRMCRGRVYLLERYYNAAGYLYHRHCYRGYQRSSSLQRSKQASNNSQMDSSTSSGASRPSPEKVGAQSSPPRNANCLPSSSAAVTRESRLPCNGDSSVTHDAGGGRVTAVSSHSLTTSASLVKTLYTPPSYKQADTAVTSVTPAVSNVSVTVGKVVHGSSSATSLSTVSPASNGSGVVKLIGSIAVPDASQSAQSNATSVSAANRSTCTMLSVTVPESSKSGRYDMFKDVVSGVTAASETSRTGMLNVTASRTTVPEKSIYLVSGITTVSPEARRSGLVNHVTASSTVQTSRTGMLNVTAGRTTVPETSKYCSKGMCTDVVSGMTKMPETSRPGLTDNVKLDRRVPESSKAATYDMLNDVVSGITTASAAGGAARLNVTTVSKTLVPESGSSRQSAVAALKAQYLQRVNGVGAPAVTTSTTVSVPGFVAARISRCNASEPGVLSNASHSSVTSSLAVCRPHERTVAIAVSDKSSSSHHSTAPLRVNHSGAVSAVASTSATASSSRGYTSPFLQDKMYIVTATTRSVPVTSLYTAVQTKSSAVTSRSSVAPLYPENRPVRRSRLSSEKNSFANVAESAAKGGSVANIELLRNHEREPISSSAVLRSQGQTAAKIAPLHLLTTGYVKMDANSRTANTMSAKTEWQLEAERRQAARKGVYMDPEKHRQKQHTGGQQALQQEQLEAMDVGNSRHVLGVHNGCYKLSASRTSPNTLSTDACMSQSLQSLSHSAGLPLRPTDGTDLTEWPLAMRFKPIRQKHSRREVNPQQQRQFMSKKSASIAAEFLLCRVVHSTLIVNIW